MNELATDKEVDAARRHFTLGLLLGFALGLTAAFKAEDLVHRSKSNVTEKCDNSACSNALSGTSHENGVGRASR